MFARPLTVALGGLVLFARCGGARQGGQAPGEPAPLRSSDAVTLEELTRVASAGTLFEALHVLRPNWFQRTPSTLRPDREGDIVVYLDQMRLGGPESLRRIRLDTVTLVRHYSPSDAEARFGLGHLHGAIQVVTTR